MATAAMLTNTAQNPSSGGAKSQLLQKAVRPDRLPSIDQTFDLLPSRSHSIVAGDAH